MGHGVGTIFRRTAKRIVEVPLAEGVSATMTSSASDGDIRVDAEAEDLVKERRRVSGRLGDGSGQIRASTHGGRIVLRQ